MRRLFFSWIQTHTLVWLVGSVLTIGVISGCARTTPSRQQPAPDLAPTPVAVPSGPMLKIVPSQATVLVGDVFTISVVLQAQGELIDGVDLRWLHFDPALLTLQDANPATPGAEITPGTLMPLTMYNVVELETGKIAFSQVVSPGTTFAANGELVLATATFTATQAGTGSFRLDFSPGATTDANVTSAGNDILGSVLNHQVIIRAR